MHACAPGTYSQIHTLQYVLVSLRCMYLHMHQSAYNAETQLLGFSSACVLVISNCIEGQWAHPQSCAAMVCEASSSTPELQQPLHPLHASEQLQQALHKAAPALYRQRKSGHHQTHRIAQYFRLQQCPTVTTGGQCQFCCTAISSMITCRRGCQHTCDSESFAI